MICPFGYEVGEPPSLARCPLGFPGCGCGDELVLYDETMAQGDPEKMGQARVVETFWREVGGS